MRKNFEPQMELDATPIPSLKFNPRSRDDIPKLLYGLQFIYTNASLRDQVFEVLQEGIGRKVDFHNGRPGMDLWILLVLGTLRLGINCDYDRLHELANEHRTVRAMLGHGSMSEHCYGLQTLKDNVSLLSEDMLDKINIVVVKAGHELLKKNESDTKLDIRCDSFVVETDVEFPTDIGLLHDAVRKLIVLTSRLCSEFDLPGWRQSKNNEKKLKRFWRRAQQSNRSRKKDAEEKKQLAYTAYVEVASEYLERSLTSLAEIEKQDKTIEPKLWTRFQSIIEEIRVFQQHALRQIDQIERRVIKGETIPNEEKVYSLFEPHTEWVCKGKAGVPVELGLKVCVVEDQHQLILHHRVMENEQDVDIAVAIVKDCKEKYSEIVTCSFDRGFHSPDNQKKLPELVDQVVLPKKGKLSAEDKAKTNEEGYKKIRHQHSAVESAINALEHSGLNRCPDHGINGFRRYVALAVIARNLEIIGSHIKQRELEKLRAEEAFHRRLLAA